MRGPTPGTFIPRAAKVLFYGLVLVTGGLLADFAVNVVTGGSLPGLLDRYRYFAWPTIVVLFVVSVAAAVRDRLRRPADGPRVVVDGSPDRAVGPSTLPPVASEFTGRERDVAELRRLVPAAEAQPRAAPVVATVYGPAGVGKSTLVVRFAHEMRPRYPDAQLYVNLQGFGPEPLDPADALARLVRALGVRGHDLPTDLDGLSSLYRSSLQGKRAIVVLDHAVDEAQVRPLLPGVPTCLVLVTSLQPLDELIASAYVRLTAMDEAEAVALLARIAGDHVRSPENLKAVERIAALCGHLPLALSIVGVLLRRNGGRPVAELEAQLTDKREDLLTGLHVGELDVRVGFDVSYERLEARERALFRRLRLLPEPTFGADMAGALLGCPVAEAERLLDGLVDEQLLERVGDGRFMLQNLLGLYAEEKLREEPQRERQAALARVLRLHVETTTRHAALLDPAISEVAGGVPSRPACSLDDQLAALDWFERERANLLKVVRQAAEIGVHDVVWRLAASLVPFFELRGHRSDWTEVQDVAMRSVDAHGDLRARAWTELGTGQLRWLERDHAEALGHLEEALETAMAGRWPRLEARARYLMGRVASDSGRLDEALARYDRAANLYQEQAMAREQGSIILDTAVALYRRGVLPPGDVIRLEEDARAALARVPEELWVARTTGLIADHLGHVYEELGHHARADKCYLDARAAFTTIGHRPGVGRARRDLCRARLEQGNAREALALAEESVASFRAMGDRYEEGRSLLLAGDAHARIGHRRDARASWQEALAAFADVGAVEAFEAQTRLTEDAAGAEPARSLVELACEFLEDAGFQVAAGNADEPTLCSPKPRSGWLRQFPDPIAVVFQIRSPLDAGRVRTLCERSLRVLGAGRPATILAVVDRDPTSSGWFQIETYRAEDIRFVVIDDRVIAEGRASGKPQERLRTLLQRFLSERDLYGRRDPVSGAFDFFGRGALTTRLTESLVAGQPALLVGLRKIGKTSVLQAVRDRLPCPAALVDVEKTESPAQLLEHIWTDWHCSAAVKMADLSWPEELRPSWEHPASFVAATARLLEQLDQHGFDAKLALLLDEADILFPRGDQDVARYLAIGRLLRGLVQEQGGRVALVLVCVDPALNRTGRVGGEQNPFYQFFVETYVPALDGPDCGEMIASIGKRMGLQYDDRSLQFVFDASGGHPFIARQLCSQAVHRLPTGASRVTLPDLHETAELFIREPGTSELLDDEGLWGDVSAAHLWSSAQAAANVSILTALAQAPSVPERDLVTRAIDWPQREHAVAELTRRAVLRRTSHDAGQDSNVQIRSELFRSWIRRYKLGLDDR